MIYIQENLTDSILEMTAAGLHLAAFILVANRDDDNVVVFRRDESTGLLTYTGTEVHVPMAVFVTQLILN